MRKKVVHNSIYKSFHNFFSSIISIVLMLFISVSISRILGAAEKGKYEIILNTINLLVGLLGLSLQSGITYVLAAYQSGISKIVIAILITSCVQGFIAFIILKIFGNTSIYSSFMPGVIVGNDLYILMGFLTSLTLLNSYLRSILVAYAKIVEANTYDLISKSILVLSVILFFFRPSEDKMSYVIFIWLNCLTMFVGSILFLSTSLSYLQDTQSIPSNIKKIVSFSIPSYLGNTIQLLNYRLDIFFVAYFTKDISQVGCYTLAVSIAQLIWLIPRSISSIILPKIAAKNDEQSSLSLILLTTYVAKLVSVISLLIAITMAILLPKLIPIAYGQEFKNSTPSLLLLLPGTAFFSFTNVMSAYIAGIGKPIVNFYIALLGLIVTIVFDVLLIPYYKIEGAALASTLSYTISTIAVIYWISKQSNLKFSQILIPSYAEIKLVIKKVRNQM
jgi:O-antigen/teichoic acid export membrane protein